MELELGAHQSVFECASCSSKFVVVHSVALHCIFCGAAIASDQELSDQFAVGSEVCFGPGFGAHFFCLRFFSSRAVFLSV